MNNISSNHLKTAVMADLRFNKKCFLVATEAGIFYADVLGFDGKRLIEVEIKISKQDLLSDLKKDKHKYFSNIPPDDYWSKYIPNQFYYCVPRCLVNEALEMTKDFKYGVIEYNGGLFNDIKTVGSFVKIIKPSKFLHKNIAPPDVQRVLSMRSSSELINHKIKNLII